MTSQWKIVEELGPQDLGCLTAVDSPCDDEWEQLLAAVPPPGSTAPRAVGGPYDVLPAMASAAGSPSLLAEGRPSFLSACRSLESDGEGVEDDPDDHVALSALTAVGRPRREAREAEAEASTPSPAARQGEQDSTPPKHSAAAASRVAGAPQPAASGWLVSPRSSGTLSSLGKLAGGGGAEALRESLAGYAGTLEIELLGASGFQVVASERLPREAWEAISGWPGAEKEGRGRWSFRPALYPDVARRLQDCVAQSPSASPPFWVLASIPPFKPRGKRKIAKKVAHVLRADVSQPRLPAEVRSQDGHHLLRYQREGVEFGLRRGARVLIGDEMGLGKTAQALVLMAQYPADWPCLVLCPASLCSTWREEAARWLPDMLPDPEKQIQLVRKGSDTYRPESRLCIVSYDLAARNPHLLRAPGRPHFRVVICDEAHYLKSPSSQRSAMLLPLLQRARRCALLSGTPAVGRASELFTPLAALLPGLVPAYDDFCERYCEKKEFQVGRRRVRNWVGSRRGRELEALLKSTVMIRRFKADVLGQLPEKRRQRVLLEKGSSQEARELQDMLRDYTAAEAGGDGGYGGRSGSNAMELFRLTAMVKSKSAQDYVDYLVEAGCRFVLFAHHKGMMDALEETIKKRKAQYIRIDGSLCAQRREELVEEFRSNHSVQVALLSLTACGTGLNLQCCSTVVFAELHWTPGVLIQAEDRVHRMGQRYSVNVHYLIARGTLDEHIYNMLERKHQEMGVVLDGKARGIGARQVQGAVGTFSTALGAQVDPGRAGGRSHDVSQLLGRKRPASREPARREEEC